MYSGTGRVVLKSSAAAATKKTPQSENAKKRPPKEEGRRPEKRPIGESPSSRKENQVPKQKFAKNPKLSSAKFTTRVINNNEITIERVDGYVISRRGGAGSKPSEAAEPGESASSRSSSVANVSEKEARKANGKKNNNVVVAAAVPENANKTMISPPPPPVPADAEEINFLRSQLAEMASEKLSLGSQLGKMHGEIGDLKKLHEKLTEENNLLRNRLKDVAHSPLSDNEKQQLLLESHRHHNSAPASIATNLLDDGTPTDITSCTTPDWDKQSNVSEISVACLQDKINQMQETHYSTNEELQATLQELTDLQRHLSELQQDNEQLLEEKNLMFDSLCRQTERLNESKSELESLKQNIGKEKELINLLNSVREERDLIFLNREEINEELREANEKLSKTKEKLVNSEEKIKELELELEAKRTERKDLEKELFVVRDDLELRKIENARLAGLLESAKTAIQELEESRDLKNDRSEFDELLDGVRKEKNLLEAEVGALNEQVARGRNENDKLKEQVSVLQEENKAVRASSTRAEAQLRRDLDAARLELADLADQLARARELADGLRAQAQRQLEDAQQLALALAEARRAARDAERARAAAEAELEEARRARRADLDEWERFQEDLLTSVRVANDFKTEAQMDLQRVVTENRTQRERVRQLEAAIEKMRGEGGATTIQLRPTSFPNTTTIEDLQNNHRRQKMSNFHRQTSRQSVKSLIETIENAGRTSKNSLSTASRSSSNSSINSSTTDGGLVPIQTPLTPLTSPEWTAADCAKPKPEQQSTATLIKNNLNVKSTDYSRRNSYSDLSERKDPLNSLIKNGGSKRNALLKWCQTRTVGYRNIDITNFSSSWNDGMALCALLHTYTPAEVPYDTLVPHEKRRNFGVAFAAAEKVGITTTLNINDMTQLERPDWQQVMGYVTAIYKHFEA